MKNDDTITKNEKRKTKTKDENENCHPDGKPSFSLSSSFKRKDD